MNLFKLAKFLFANVRKFVKDLENKHFIRRLSRTVALDHSDQTLTANVLVVKKPIYCELAKICVVSFLHFHPKSKVRLSVDHHTREAATKLFRKEIKKGTVFLELIEGEQLSWQKIKMNIVLSLQTSSDFFMDADLRWNGKLPTLKGITFFVEEFKLKNRSPYAQLIQIDELNSYSESSMKNTSFVFWGDYKISEGEKKLTFALESEILKAVSGNSVPLDDKAGIVRISEQLALSLMADNLDSEIQFLKTVDGHRDGSFLESSYFGATGSQF